jgi:hypothetical protein
MTDSGAAITNIELARNTIAYWSERAIMDISIWEPVSTHVPLTAGLQDLVRKNERVSVYTNGSKKNMPHMHTHGNGLLVKKCRLWYYNSKHFRCLRSSAHCSSKKLEKKIRSARCTICREQ